MRDTFDGADAEAGDVAGGDPDGVADGFANHRAGLIGTGVAIISAAAAGKQQTTRQRNKTIENEKIRFHSHFVLKRRSLRQQT